MGIYEHDDDETMDKGEIKIKRGDSQIKTREREKKRGPP